MAGISRVTIKQASLAIIFLALVLRIITFITSVNFGADSISRSFISLNWSADPFLIWHPNSQTSVWLPLQFYLNGLFLMLWDNVRVVPRLVVLAASLISLFVFFGLAKQIFDREKAYWAAACFSLYSLHIKFGNIAGSESLFVLFMLAAMYGYHRFLEKQGWGRIISLSLSLLGAVMIRFEAWILLPFILLALLYHARNSDPIRRRRILTGAVTAVLLPALFMVLWLYGSFKEYGDMLYSVHAASSEHTELTRQMVGSLGNLKATLYRAAFWPGVIMISLSPLVIIAGLWGAILTFSRRRGLIWIIFLMVQVVIYLYQSLITGGLAPLARYAILPGTILCLFSVRGGFDLADRYRHSKLKKPILQLLLASMLIWVILLSPDYLNLGRPALKKLAAVSPVTRYPDSVNPIISWLKTNLGPGQKVIFSTPDFTSNAVIMYSGMSPEQIVSVRENSLEDMNEKISISLPAYLICHRQGPLLKTTVTEGLDSSLTIGNMLFQLTDRAGDFGIYIPEHQP